MKKPKLLAPAGDLYRLKVAILYGADAVFIGGKFFSLRAKANNFSLKDIEEGVLFAHQHHAKVYVTVNIVPNEDDFKNLSSYLLALDRVNVDAIIVSSISVLLQAKKLHCRFEVHISTQHSILNSYAIQFFKNLGADRVVLARELNILEIQQIKKNTTLPLEVFIHGGMCSSFSGRCTLSNAMANRDANKGGCAHSCRWSYFLYHEETPISDKEISFASTDLMGINYLPQLIDAQIDSFKIEGRMKSIYYIANVVKIYRQFIDFYCQFKKIDKKQMNYYKKELLKIESRSLSPVFLNPHLKNEGILIHQNTNNANQSFIGMILEDSDSYHCAFVEQRNHFTLDTKVEIIQPNQPNQSVKMLQMWDLNDNPLTIARHPQQIIKIQFSKPVKKDAIMRRK